MFSFLVTRDFTFGRGLHKTFFIASNPSIENIRLKSNEVKPDSAHRLAKGKNPKATHGAKIFDNDWLMIPLLPAYII